MIRNEKEVLMYLNIPSLPKKEWDGVKSFKYGVAIVGNTDGTESYAVATYDSERNNAPRIIKTFDIYPFSDIKSIYVVPSYMDTQDVEGWDLDEESKKAAERVIEEAQELESEDKEQTQLPKSEYCYDFITNDEEAIAYIRAYNKSHGVRNSRRGSLPKSHDAIITRLATIWMDETRKEK